MIQKIEKHQVNQGAKIFFKMSELNNKVNK